jgi:hypothetical protein
MKQKTPLGNLRSQHPSGRSGSRPPTRSMARKRPLTGRVLGVLCIVAGALAAGGAGAQSMDRQSQRAWGRIGLLQAHVDSLVRIDYLGGTSVGLPVVGTTLDFEDDLGLRGRQALLDVALGLRLYERWRLEFGTYSLRRSATRTLLDDEVTIDGVTYSAAADLHSRFSSRVQRLSLGYSLLKSPVAEAGLALGVQYTRYSLAFSGDGRFNGEPPSMRSVEEHDKGPLPTIGVFGAAVLSGPWSAAARLDHMPVDSRRLRGYLSNVEANLYYRLSAAWSLGVGYKAVSYKLTRKSSGDFGALFEYRFRGPQVLLEAGF